MSELAQYQQFIISRSRLIYLGFWFIIPFCSFAIHTIFLLPPTLVLFFFGTIFLFSSSKTISASTVTLLPIICIAYFIVSQTIIGAPFGRYMGVIFAICYFIVTVLFGPNLSTNQRNSLVQKFILFSTILLIVECVMRMTNPAREFAQFEGTGDVRWIYQYKMTGFMYSDSNVVGFHIMVLFFFVLYEEKVHGIKRPKTKMILLGLLLFSFSRAAWFGTTIGWIYIVYLRKKRFDFYVVNLFFLSIISLILYRVFLVEKIQKDLSFRSKIEIVDIVFNYFKTSSFSEILFGIGFSNSTQRLGIYAHNFFMVFIIESGLVGFLLIILLFLQFIFITNRKALFILIPFVISTASNTVTFMPYFYIVIALIHLDQKYFGKEANVLSR